MDITVFYRNGVNNARRFKHNPFLDIYLHKLIRNGYHHSIREIKKYQWDIQGKGKSTITDKLRRARTRQKQHKHNTKN